MRKRNISPEYVMHESVSFDLLLSIPTQCNMLIRASVDALYSYVGMARVKSHVIRIQNAF